MDFAHQDAFGQFQFQAGRWQAGLVEDIGDPRAELAVGELPRGDVHRHLRYPHARLMPGLELAARLGDHPVAHIHHQPQFLDHRDEVARRHQPALRVAPAQQRLGASQTLAVAAELRLVIEDEFVLLEGVAQVAFQFQALQGAGVHVCLIELEVVLAALLGVVHRGVGVLHQLAQFAAVLRAQGDTDTGGDEELAVFQDERPHQVAKNLLGHIDRAVQRHFPGGPWLQQQGELVATHAGHGVVVIDTAQQALGHVLEHTVAGGVAEGVVDRLETVQVEEHQHHPGLLPLGLLQRVVQAVLEQRAVGQVGQGVVVRQAVDALLAGLALADVGEEAHVAGQVAFVVEHSSDADPRRVVLAAASLEPDFAFPGAALVQLLEHIAQVRFLLFVDGEHARQLVEHIAHRVAADPAERFVGLDDVAGRVGDEDRRGGVFEYRGGHAQVFFCAALLADVAADAENAAELVMFVPDQHQAQFDGNLAAVGAQAIEQEQLRGHLGAQGFQLRGVAQCAVDPLDQGVEPGQLRRVGDGRLPAIAEHPFDVVAQHHVHRGADVVQVQLVIGGEDHVADALGEHAVALFAVAQRFAGFELVGDILGHADDPRDAAGVVAGQRLLADVIAAPALVVMAEAKLAVQLLDVAALALLLAQGLVQLGVFGVQEDFPEELAHLRQFVAGVAQGLAQMAVAENHPQALHILDVELVRHGAHDVGPEAFALQQRQLDTLAAGDIADAEDHCVIVATLPWQTDHQPQVLVQALLGRQADFQFQLRLVVEHRTDQLQADAVVFQDATGNQLAPGAIAAIDPEQLQGDLVHFSDFQFAEQAVAQGRIVFQALFKFTAAAQAQAFEGCRQAGQVEHAQGDAGAFENILIAAPAFLQDTVAAAHVDQCQQRQQGTEDGEDGLADQCREQFAPAAFFVVKAAQLPVAVVQIRQHHVLQRRLLGVG